MKNISLKKKILAYILIFTFVSQVEPASAANPETINFSICKSANESNCIDSVGVEGENGKISWGTRVPNSSFEFEIADEIFASGDGRIGFSMSWRPDGAPLCWWNSCDYHSGSIDMIIWPTGTKAGKNAGTLVFEGNNQLQCGIVSAPVLCGKWWNFGKDVRFVFKFRAKGFKIGMISGRSKNVSFEDLDANLAPEESHTFYVKASNIVSDSYVINDIRTAQPADRPRADYFSDGLILWFWDQNNTATSRLPQRCNSKNITGPPTQLLFNTFNMGAPNWNAAESSLSVQLESSHLAHDGSVNKGFYEMVFSKATASCLWGIDPKLNAKAEVSISYSDGQIASVATVSQDFSENQFRITAANFHLSKPIISTKLANDISQSDVKENSDKVSSSAISPISKVELKKTTITCIKGKLTKKVTAVNPKCPAGYKKK